MNYTQIKETCLYIEDLEGAEKFYKEILGFPLISKIPERHVFFKCGTSILLCFNPHVTQQEQNLPPHFAHGKQHIAFEVKKEEYETTKKEILSKGIAITHCQSWKDQLESFYFEDPFGHVLEIVPNGIWD
jgi:catechol 2,3-dioxygenase-like lactoylglutathione lyase family enzyme